MKPTLSRRSYLRLGLGSLGFGLGAGLGIHPRSTPQVHAADNPSAEVRREFIYNQAPFPECHASTIVETRTGLMAAWFGGTAEGRDDVCIYTARRSPEGWSAPEKVADGRTEGDGGPRQFPCWNPVLFQPRDGPLLLFYKVGPRPHSWWGIVRTSADDGRTWSAPRRLPDGILGPVRAKPIQLADGRILCGSSTEHAGWQVQMEWTQDPLGSWERTPPLNRGEEWGAIQPTVLAHPGGDLQILCRSRQAAILESWSRDGGRTWTALARTPLPNPSSGIDAVALRDGRFLLVYNHTPRGRAVLNVAISSQGREWAAAHILEQEPGEFSYPAVIQSADGLVHFTYTWKRQRIRYVALDPARLRTRPMPNGEWPS